MPRFGPIRFRRARVSYSFMAAGESPAAHPMSKLFRTPLSLVARTARVGPILTNLFRSDGSRCFYTSHNEELSQWNHKSNAK